VTNNQPPTGPQNWQGDPNQQWQQHPQQWQQHPQQWQQQPQKMRGGCFKWFAIIAGIIVVLIIVIAAISAAGGGNNDSTSDSSQPGNSESKDADEQQNGSTVKFEVETADGSNVSVTYTSAGDGASQAQDNATASPWSKEIQVDKHGMLNVNVLAQQEGSGDVTCRILVDGEEVNSNTSSGPYSIATCNFADFLR